MPDRILHRSSGMALGALSAICFSASLVLARMTYDAGSNAMTIMAVRFALLLSLLLVWNALSERRSGITLHARALCYLCGIAYFVGIGGYLSSVAYLPVSLAVLIFYTFPLITVFLNALLNRCAPSRTELGLIGAAFVGLAIALDVQTSGIHPLGIAFAVAAAAGVAVNLVVSARVMGQVGMKAFAVHMSTATLVCSIAACVITNSFALPAADSSGQLAFLAMLLLFLLGFFAVYAAIQSVGPVLTSAVLNLEPLATILIALAVLGETLSPRQIIGGGLILAAVGVAQFAGRSR